METQDLVLAGASPQCICFKVEGRGYFQNSRSLKEYAQAMIQEKGRDIIVNLEKCVSMDSTFMGVLAGLAIELKKKHGKSLKVMQISQHNRELLETLGLTHLLEIMDVPVPAPEETHPLKKDGGDKEALSQHMLEAHETLSCLNEMNQIKFKNVMQILQEALERKKT